MSVLTDSGFLVSLINQREKHHQDCVRTLNILTQRIVIPATVIPEVTHLLAKRISHRAMRDFVEILTGSDWHIENLTREDLVRAGELLSVYADARLDFADATIVAMAERLGVETILTLDRRDFSMVRPKHTPHFKLLP